MLSKAEKASESARVCCELLGNGACPDTHTRERRGENNGAALKSFFPERKTTGGKDKMAVAAVQISHPEPFDLNSNPSWCSRSIWEISCRIRIKGKKHEEHQVKSLLYAMGDAADDIWGVLPMTDENKKKYDAVKSCIWATLCWKTQCHVWKSSV